MPMLDTLTEYVKQHGEEAAVAVLREATEALKRQRPLLPIYSEEEVIERGTRIYRAWSRDWCEASCPGDFIAIEVHTSCSIIGKTVQEVVAEVHRLVPNGQIFWTRINPTPSAAAMLRPATVH
jgi:hypothetical protein